MAIVCHMTSAHPRYDTRIFIKECQSLVRAGFDVTLVVADGEGTSTKSGVTFFDIGRRRGGRIGRFLTAFWPMFYAARKIDADLYHFHDPELIPAGILLKLQGCKVIFDVHEDLPAQIQSKTYIPRHLKPLATILVRLIEWIATKPFNGYIAVNDEISRRFPKDRTIKVHNFPILSEITGNLIPYKDRMNEIVFIGICSEARGVRKMIEAVNMLPDHLEAQLSIAGPVVPSALQEQLEKNLDCSKIKFLGWQSREQIRARLSSARIGLVVFKPEPNHVNAMPNKLFDYMGVGLPVIASDFAKWREIVEGLGCGLVVNPMSGEDIALAIEQLLGYQEEAAEMGHRGYLAATEDYNWDTEAKRLVDLYNIILQDIN